MNGNQLSGTGSASAALVCEISEIVVDMTAGNVLRTDDSYIIRMEPGNTLLIICAICPNRWGALVQFVQKLIQ